MVRYLVERIRQKDQRAMSQLYKMYVKRLSSVCYRYVPNENDAKDVLQNSFVKIFTTIPTIDYQGEDAFWNWMKKVVANEALCYLRERKRYRTVINLHIFEGYPHKKIAELLGITESTSSSQLYFAKRALAKRIKELLNDKQ